MAERGVVRSIGGIVAQVTVEERHHDQTMITSHPIESGAPITDHAYDMPSVITITAGWSNSSSAQLVDDTGAMNYVRAIYNKFLELRAAKQPLTVLTGKRSYKNMLIETLDVVTNAATEHAMLLTATLRQVFLVETQIVQVTKPDVQASAQQTGSVQQRGTQQLKTVQNVSKPAQAAAGG